MSGSLKVNSLCHRNSVQSQRLSQQRYFTQKMTWKTVFILAAMASGEFDPTVDIVGCRDVGCPNQTEPKWDWDVANCSLGDGRGSPGDCGYCTQRS